MRFKSKKLLALSLVLSLGMSVIVTACSNGSSSKKETVTFKIGSQGYAEVEILAEIFKQLTEANTPYKVEHVKNFGSSLASHQATVKNELQFYTGFTGTIFMGALQQKMADKYRDPKVMYTYVHDTLLKDNGLYVAKPYGYNNIYTIAVPRAWAEKHNITKQSQLAPYAKDMVLGVDQTWLTLPGMGYSSYADLYGFKFKSTPAMDIGLLYQAIDKGQVDAVNVYSTDGQLSNPKLLALIDDKNFNPPYNGVLVARNDVVDKYPEVKKVLDMLDGLIDTEQMQKLNKSVVIDQKEPSVVAKEFLQSKGLIK